MMFIHMWSMLFICYMSITCICLLYVVIVICLLYVICLLWGVVGLGYIISNAHLCNHILFKVVVGPGAQICTLLEVWALGVGMSTLGA